MKELIDRLILIDEKINDCRYYLTLRSEEKEKMLFDTLNEMSKEIKKILDKTKWKGGEYQWWKNKKEVWF